jgi:hypothetical protein
MADTGKRWAEFYRRALLESDRSLLPNRIEEAREAIRCRARELWYAGPLETKERHDLDAAVQFLRLLSTGWRREMKRREVQPLHQAA